MGRYLVGSWLLLAGCGAAESSLLEPDPQILEDAGVRDSGFRRDAGPAQDAGEVDAELPTQGIEVGIGEDVFRPIGAGERVPLTAGPQGGGAYYGYHVWFSVRADDTFDPQRAKVDIEVRQVASDEILGYGSYEYDLRPIAGGSTIAGMRAILKDCCMAEDHELVLTAVVTDRNGHRGEDHRTVIGESKCFDPANPNYDPCP